MILSPLEGFGNTALSPQILCPIPYTSLILLSACSVFSFGVTSWATRALVHGLSWIHLISRRPCLQSHDSVTNIHHYTPLSWDLNVLGITCSELAQKVPSHFPGFGNSNTILSCYFGSQASTVSVRLTFVMWNALLIHLLSFLLPQSLITFSFQVIAYTNRPYILSQAQDPPVSHIKTKACLTVFLWEHRWHSMCELYEAMLQKVPLHTEYMTTACNNAVYNVALLTLFWPQAHKASASLLYRRGTWKPNFKSFVCTAFLFYPVLLFRRANHKSVNLIN